MNFDVVWDQEPPLSADGSGTWGTFCHLWDDCILLIGGAGIDPQEALKIYQKLDDKKKKKIIKVIVWLKGERFEESKAIEDYKVTVEDIKLVLERNQKINEKLKLKVSNISME